MNQRDTEPDQRRAEPIVSLAAVIAAGLATATILSPHLGFGFAEP